MELITAADAEPEPAGTACPPVAILVVDDRAAQRLSLRAMLAPLGHHVVEADSGAAALRAVLRRSFAVILMDVRMPVMDGYETANLIRSRPRSEATPIIFVTSFGGDETEKITAYAYGAVDFIFTPILPEVLRAKVARFVEIFVQTQTLQRSFDSITTLNAALRESEARARTVLQNVADGIVTTGEEGLIESFNRSAQRLLGYREDEVVGKPLQLIIAPGHQDEFADPARATRSLRTASDIPAEPVETVGCRKDGSCFPMEMGMSRMQIGKRTLTIGCIRDISGRQAHMEALERRALHDDLTGLPNRVLFGSRMDEAIAAAHRADELRSALVLDVNEFRKVNEEVGREGGDVVLQEVAERLSGALRDSATVARLDSDEFGILPAGTTDVEASAACAWKLREAFARPFLIGRHVLHLRPNIGIAFFPQHGRVTADVLRRARQAMQEARHSDGGIAVFVAEPEDETTRRMTRLSELRGGIERGELVLHFQPKVDLRTRRTTGVEALVRWRHPTAGLLMPGQFMATAEGSELIEPLTTWVLDEALHQQRRWTDAGLDLTMAVNISARSLGRGSDLPDTMARLTETWDIAPGRLILELTENAILAAEVPDVLDLLHAMGERLAIDDFGTGYSSLVRLRQLPIDEIKIDRSFVTSLASVQGDAVIVKSTIDLAHNLGLTVVAEGIEDQAALDMLVDYGCDTAQGYFFSRPYPADELTTWLTESPLGASALEGRSAPGRSAGEPVSA